MADEITVLTGLNVKKGNLSVTIPQRAARYTLTGATRASLTQIIGTTHEALSIAADVATAGWAHFYNTDATNYVEIGVVESSTFRPVVKLAAGAECVVPMATLLLYAKANTASVKLDFTIFEA